MAPPISCAAPLCTAARRLGSASMVIGTMKGPRNRPIRPAAALAETNSQAGIFRPNSHQTAR